MNYPPTGQPGSPRAPRPTWTGALPEETKRPASDTHPHRPDWLLIMIGILILATLLIVWLVDLPLPGR